jgi:hypothetical protein
LETTTSDLNQGKQKGRHRIFFFFLIIFSYIVPRYLNYSTKSRAVNHWTSYLVCSNWSTVANPNEIYRQFTEHTKILTCELLVKNLQLSNDIVSLLEMRI